MKYLSIPIVLLFLLTACSNRNTSRKTHTQVVKTTPVSELASLHDSLTTDKAYVLMKQFCLSCHFEKPDPAKRDQMQAPPMANVQRHYKSAYPQKNDFIKAVVNWVNHPSEEKILMPGAARRFGLMPALPIGDDKLTLIAKGLYNYKFQTTGHKHHGNTMKQQTEQILSKVKLQPDDMKKLNKLIDKLNQNHPQTVEAYRNLGKNIFDKAKTILLNNNYKNKDLRQIQRFFHDIEDDMHHLMSVENVKDGAKYQKKLQQKFNNIDKFFY